MSIYQRSQGKSIVRFTISGFKIASEARYRRYGEKFNPQNVTYTPAID